jgi:hypothetical protein
MNGFAPPLADVGEIIGVVVFILFVLVSGVGQLIAKIQEAQREAARRVRAPQPRVAPANRGTLEDEIGEFLQKTAQRRDPERSSPPAPPPASTLSRPLGPPLSSAARPAAPPPPSAVPVAEPVLQAEVLADHAGVADHVRTYLAGGRFDRETTGLGSEVAQADEKMEEHLRQAFEHRLGRLGTMGGATASVQPAAAPAVAPAAAAGVAAELAAMLRTPASMRQAVVVSEVLTRPVHRWS